MQTYNKTVSLERERIATTQLLAAETKPALPLAVTETLVARREALKARDDSMVEYWFDDHDSVVYGWRKAAA